MLVWNAHRTNAIVIRNDGRNIRLVPMKSGKLVVVRTTRDKFDAEWQPHEYPLEKALSSFLEHAHQQGATSEALKGLQTLAARDQTVIHPLF
ncbi:MAG: hypothetical protein H6R18_1771 [Proteobacteria bacterium]|nr:hypothetical protein [Pseudomonadota bacterium]